MSDASAGLSSLIVNRDLSTRSGVRKRRGQIVRMICIPSMLPLLSRQATAQAARPRR